MDTPGLLPPKIATPEAQWKLALIGAVPRERYDPEEVAAAFHHWLLAQNARTTVPDLEAFAARADSFAKAARSIITTPPNRTSRLQRGAFGRISLEAPDDPEAA